MGFGDERADGGYRPSPFPDDDIGTVRWFGPTWHAPVNDPRTEISVPLGENCIRCQGAFDHGDQGIATAASLSLSENGQVFYHRDCFFQALGIQVEEETFGCR